MPGNNGAAAKFIFMHGTKLYTDGLADYSAFQNKVLI